MSESGSPLLLLGSARSGTTLLQRIMNSYDDVIIWGEHGGVLQYVADSYFDLIESKSMKEFSYPQAKGNAVALASYKNPEQWQAWNNWFTDEDVKEIYKKFLSNMFLSSWEGKIKYWGFKEIRYGATDKVIDMLFSTHPDARVLVLYRNPLNVIDSQLHAFHDIGGRLQKLRKLMSLTKIVRMSFRWRLLNRQLLKYHHAQPDKVLIMRYEEMISDNRTLESVLNRIGLTFGEKQKTVLELKSGRGSAYHGKGAGDTNKRWKRLGVIPSAVVYLITRSVYADLNRLSGDVR